MRTISNIPETNCPNFVSTVVSDLCCCDLLCGFCPKTCLQPTVPIVSQLLCVICVAVICLVDLSQNMWDSEGIYYMWVTMYCTDFCTIPGRFLDNLLSSSMFKLNSQLN